MGRLLGCLFGSKWDGTWWKCVSRLTSGNTPGLQGLNKSLSFNCDFWVNQTHTNVPLHCTNFRLSVECLIRGGSWDVDDFSDESFTFSGPAGEVIDPPPHPPWLVIVITRLCERRTIESFQDVNLTLYSGMKSGRRDTNSHWLWWGDKMARVERR